MSVTISIAACVVILLFRQLLVLMLLRSSRVQEKPLATVSNMSFEHAAAEQSFGMTRASCEGDLARFVFPRVDAPVLSHLQGSFHETDLVNKFGRVIEYCVCVNLHHP